MLSVSEIKKYSQSLLNNHYFQIKSYLFYEITNWFLYANIRVKSRYAVLSILAVNFSARYTY